MNKKIIIVLSIIMIIISAVATYLIIFKGESVDIKEFNVKAFRFGYEPNVIRVNRGDRVKIKIDNSDTLHGIRIPELDAKGMNSVEFIAENEGEFVWYCNNYCGSDHKEMRGRIIVR